jgi:apolipoprotein D and lipocalin family protein
MEKSTTPPMLHRLRIVAAVLLSCWASGCYDSGPPPSVAEGVELQRFAGHWYEIAKLPHFAETDCTATTAEYSLVAPDQLEVRSECRVGSFEGPLKTMNATARVIDARVPAKLGLKVHGFTGDHWILEVGDDYEYAAVANPSREYLWILSRERKLAADKLAGVLERAGQQHFGVQYLEFTPQPP